jgi:hypothetical protein
MQASAEKEPLPWDYLVVLKDMAVVAARGLFELKG